MPRDVFSFSPQMELQSLLVSLSCALVAVTAQNPPPVQHMNQKMAQQQNVLRDKNMVQDQQ